MDVKRYLEILELTPDASMDDLNQAYRDLVNIWHPDRFARNPRLMKKAEEKLKELNEAYEALKPVLSSESMQKKNAWAGNQAEAGIDAEGLVEAGTATVLRLWSYLSTRLRGLVAEQIQAFKEEAQDGPLREGTGRGKGMGKSRGGGQGRRPFQRDGGRSGGTRGGMGSSGA